jgi:Catalase/C-terminal domain found in long catalases
MTSHSDDARETVSYADVQAERGNGGETHQVAGGGRPSLTTQQGMVVADDQNTLRIGDRGPEGNWDLVGNNIPVFFIQDAIKFPDLIHAAKQEPDKGFPQAQTAHDNFWDFASLMPEATHMLMWIMSDRAIPRSFRFMEGFGVHTFRLVNAAVVRRRVRRPVRLRRAGPHQAHSRGAGPGPASRPPGAGPGGGQLLRRDRAGRVLHPEHRARHRLQQRKCDKAEIRSRMVAGLRNVHEDLARYVADGLGLRDMPEPAPATRPARDDLPESPALSILRNGPDSFAGRKIGVLATDGADAALLGALQGAADQEGTIIEFVTATVGGVETSDGDRIEGGQKVDGGPSVLYDAVVLLTSAEGGTTLARDPAARDFVTDAHTHAKFIGYVADAMPLLEATGIRELMDDGFIELDADGQDAGDFIEKCRELRFWSRQEA